MTKITYLQRPSGYTPGSMSIRKETQRLMLHCSATPEGRDVTFEDLWEWHVIDNGWSDVGYHYLIMLDGRVQVCRDEHYQGAGCSGQNHDTIHICYAGGLASDGETAKDTRNAAQEQVMVQLIKEIAQRYPDLDDKRDIVGHNQYAAKACPSFNVPQWVDKIIHDYETGNPEPGDPDLGNLVEYIKKLEARVAELERWRKS